MYIEFDKLEKFMEDVLIKMNVPKEDAKIVADVLISADKRGIDTHGIGRFKPIYIDRMDLGIVEPVTDIEVVRDKCATAVIDAHNGLGHVASKFAMDLAIKKAEIYGLGMTVVKNSSHYGFAGYYPLMAEKHNMIGITGTNARPSISPTFGVDNMLGTNPLTFVIPTDEEFPFFLDCATSTAQRGKVEKYQRDGKTVPDGWVIDRNGNYLHDPTDILKKLLEGEASFTPLGGQGEDTSGYKGYGYATVVEILSSAFGLGPFLKQLSGFDEDGNKNPYLLGHFFIVIDVEHFVDVDKFKKHTGDILRDLRNSAKAEGQDKIYTAGEKEYITMCKRRDLGVPIGEVLEAQINELDERFNLNFNLGK